MIKQDKVRLLFYQRNERLTKLPFCLYFYKGFIKQIFNYQEDEENNVFRRVQMGLFIEIIVLAYVILFAAKCYRPLLITDDIVSIIICNGLITLLFLLCSYRSEKKYRIFSEINGKYIN